MPLGATTRNPASQALQGLWGFLFSRQGRAIRLARICPADVM